MKGRSSGSCWPRMSRRSAAAGCASDGRHDFSLLWRVARYTSGEAVASRLAMHRQTIVETPPQSSRLTLRKRRETRIASPVADTTVPPQAEGQDQNKRREGLDFVARTHLWLDQPIVLIGSLDLQIGLVPLKLWTREFIDPFFGLTGGPYGQVAE